MRPFSRLLLLLCLSAPLGAQILVPINEAERRLIWLVESIRLSSGQKLSREEMLKFIDQGFDQFINIEAMSRDMLGADAAGFEPAEMAQFQKSFRRVLQLSILVQAGKAFNNIPLNLVKNSLYGNPYEAVFQFTPAGESQPVRIGIQFDDKGKYLKDILLNNDSLIRQYREMFSGIVKKYGRKGLLKLLERKIDELEKQAS